jgi:dienelactone hydrolase
MLQLRRWIGLAWISVSIWNVAAQGQPLAGTAPLTMEGDIASNLVAGVDRFLLRKIDESAAGRAQFWHRDFSSGQAYERSIATNRARLAYIIGARDPRASQVELEVTATPGQSSPRGRGQNYEVYAVRWPAFGDVTGEGLLLTPAHGLPIANVIAIPDADQTPEQLAGLTGGISPESQFARRLAESGCRVIIPTLINRNSDPELLQSHREYIYRAAFVQGRHLIGYEVQKVMAAVDWMSGQNRGSNLKIGVIGDGEGGMLAFYSAALDPRINAACVSGYFGDRLDCWQQPLDRNVFGLLEQFGDAEVAAMIAPRSLIIEAARGPEVVLRGGGGWEAAQRYNGAPAILVSPKLNEVRSELERARALVAKLKPSPQLELAVSGDTGAGPFGSEGALSPFLTALAGGTHLEPQGRAPENLWPGFDPAARQARQFHELDRHNQQLLAESPYTREKFMAKLDTSSPEKFLQSADAYRDFFYRQVIGRFDDAVLPANPRSRVKYDQPKWTGYEVVLDVFPDVIAYGDLLLPKDIKPGERRPVVVCQHGLEGRPEDTITGDSKFYHNFAARLCDQGFVVFAPQNPYLFHDRFRTLQRKANPLGKTLFSIIVPEHQQITDWLKTQPFVDPARIGFYGLSYGGKTALRVPALVTNYCLSICSGDFNDWVWKCTSSLSPYSYLRMPEYEIFEFDLGTTFNYSEMTALIAPRPFMVERGHFDQVAPDETVAYEFAKTRFLYEARLGLRDQCAIEWFTGPHMINGKGTFDFLHRHLAWPVASDSQGRSR